MRRRNSAELSPAREGIAGASGHGSRRSHHERATDAGDWFRPIAVREPRARQVMAQRVRDALPRPGTRSAYPWPQTGTHLINERIVRLLWDKHRGAAGAYVCRRVLRPDESRAARLVANRVLPPFAPALAMAAAFCCPGATQFVKRVAMPGPRFQHLEVRE
jgi:hypothetical protein